MIKKIIAATVYWIDITILGILLKIVSILNHLILRKPLCSSYFFFIENCATYFCGYEDSHKEVKWLAKDDLTREHWRMDLNSQTSIPMLYVSDFTCA